MAGVPMPPGLTRREGLLVAEVALALLAAAVWFQSFSLHSTQPATRARVVERLTDASTLLRVATSDADESVRSAAVAKLSDAATLIGIANSDESATVRLHAVRRIDDAATLALRAEHDPSASVRKEAIGRVKDPGVLARLAFIEPEPPLRRMLAERIEDQRVLGRLATKDADEGVRAEATKRLTDATALLDLALHDRDFRVSESARQRLSASALSAAAVGEGDSREGHRLRAAALLWQAAQRLPQNQRDRVIARLLMLCRHYSEPHWIARFGSLRALTLEWQKEPTQYGLFENVVLKAAFARGSQLTTQWHNSSIDYIAAVIPHWAGDQTALARIARSDEAQEFRLEAIGRLKDKAALDELSKHDPDRNIRRGALMRLEVMRRW